LDLIEFKKLYIKFTARSLPEFFWQTKEYAKYIDAINEDAAIGDWYLKEQIKKSNVKVGRHCCTKMTYYLTLDKRSENINPDAIIRYNKKQKEYGIPIHDGGSSYVKIDACPWCGRGLNKKIK
jgi:hypothetical protein